MHDKRILLIGDSITEGFDTRKLLSEFNIVNKGISGNNSSDLLARLRPDVINHNPDFVFILIGTNDLAQGFTDEEILKNIALILKTITNQLKVCKVFLTSILPTRNNEPRPNRRINILNTHLKLLAEKLEGDYLDLNKMFCDEDGQLKSDFTEDGLHLNDKAYELWANYFRTYLNNLLNLSTS